MKINIFLIKTIKSLGNHISLEEDIVDFLLDILKRQILNFKEETMDEIKNSDSNKELKIQNERLLNLFMRLTILKSQYFENRKYFARLLQQAPKFSAILTNVLNISNDEILGRIEELILSKESSGIFNNYSEIKQKLLKT